MEDWKKRAPRIIILVQFMVIIYLFANWMATREVLELNAENRQLRAAVTARTTEACRVQVQLGRAYGLTLKQLLTQLGIDKPGSAAEMVLAAFNEGKLVAPIGEEGGMGGCDTEPECSAPIPEEKASAKSKPKPKR